MNSIIDSLNHAGGAFIRFLGPMAWQCAALVALLALLDIALKRHVRAALRYGFWLLLLVKLALPPSLSSPTSAAYWLPVERQPQTHDAPSRRVTRVRVTEVKTPSPVTKEITPAPSSRPRLNSAAALFLLWAGGAIALGIWLVRRGLFIADLVRRAQTAPPELQRLLEKCRGQFSVRQRVELKLSPEISGPAVCGLWRPIILLPASMANELSPAQLRSVLVHELAHVRRLDLWVSHAQSVLQILYWWHPFVWFGNAAIRRAREQAVDEQVMIALGAEGSDYPATLVEMAKRVSLRPFPALGLVGIVERRSALKTRIRRLIERPLPSSATLSFRHLVLILIVGVIALPMNATSPREQDSSPQAAQFVTAPSTGTPTNSNLITTHAMLIGKMERLRLASFGAFNEPLSDVVARLNEAARIADPDGHGVNLLLDSNAGDGVGDCRITLQPPIANLNFRQVLDALVTVASCSLEFSIEDYAIILANRNREIDSRSLRTRWYKVDPNTMAASLKEMLGGKSAGKPVGQIPNDRVTQHPDPEALQTEIIKLLKMAGVEIRAPKSLLFNERLGMMMVRATLTDLDEVEQVIQAANATPAQVSIQTRFVQLSEGEPASAKLSAILGFDIAARKGTTLNTAQPPNARANAGPTPANLPPPVFTGILSPDQYRAAIAALLPEEGSEIMATPSVLVPTGRQAQIKTVEVRTIVTDLDQPEKPGRELMPISERFELGPCLDVVPSVMADGQTIQMRLIPSLKEFLGYDLNMAEKIAAATGVRGSIPLPIFRTRQAVTTAIVKDGQTVVLGLGTAEDPSATGDPTLKVPNPSLRKHLLVFITPTMVDPAGNRVHTE